MNVQIARTDAEIEQCYRVMVQLRPHFAMKQFVEQVRRQELQGYRLAFIATDSTVRAVAGFRMGESLAWGRYLYIDDLVTDESDRSRGLGGALFD